MLFKLKIVPIIIRFCNESRKVPILGLSQSGAGFLVFWKMVAKKSCKDKSKPNTGSLEASGDE